LPDSFPWRLRLKHLGRATVLAERPGRQLLFDPWEAPEGTPLMVITGEECDRLLGVSAAVGADTWPEVVANQEVLHWLGERGELTGQLPPIQVDGMAFETEPYTPIPWATPTEALRKAWSGLRRPDLAASRLRRKLARPGSRPQVMEVTLPDGGRLLHLGCALSSFLPDEELHRLVKRFAGADWLIVGTNYQEQQAVFDRLPAFEAKVVLVTDLHNEIRRELGMPTELLTTLVDRLCGQGIQAHPFSQGASYRFE
jgi:hypothetical protein